MKPMNSSKPDAHELIARIMASERFRSNSHFSERVYADEPLITTGRQMATYLPNQYRQMRAISRWEEGGGGQRGRWLTEAELFYRQGTFMADFEDDCPYRGVFKSYFPTYNAMSDRQLRGYFTWRAAVRRGDVQETSLSFAYVYLYELINGIGVANPSEGFGKIEAFWRAYRAFAPEIDRFASVWLQDYVIYHGLPVSLLEPYKTLSFDRALIALRRAEQMVLPAQESGGKRRKGTSALPLPADERVERELITALDALSTYHLTASRLYKHEPDALRHVACAVFVRMSAYHRKQRKNSLLESWFGEEVALAYTMFGSAVFFERAPHADTTYELDEIHRYRCASGRWTCERFHGNRSKSPRLGDMLRAVDRSLRDALDFDHPLKDTGKTPKYLQKFIDEEIAAWQSWHTAHAPLRIEIDLSQLAGIRTAAETTREALLIDEEREVEPAGLAASIGDDGNGGASGHMCDMPGSINADHAGHSTCPAMPAPDAAVIESPNGALAAGAVHAAEPTRTKRYTAQNNAGTTTLPSSTQVAAVLPSPAAPRPTSGMAGNEIPHVAYLRTLLLGDVAKRQRAISEAGASEDLIVDAVNEALFDLVGDTVIEYGADGPELIEEYRDDVEGHLNHA